MSQDVVLFIVIGAAMIFGIALTLGKGTRVVMSRNGASAEATTDVTFAVFVTTVLVLAVPLFKALPAA